MAQTISLRKGNTRLPPEVNRVLYVRNLPFNISSEEMYDIFGKYGAIRQIRIGTNKDTRGTAFVVYEDIYDAKTAVDHLSGFNVANRIASVLLLIVSNPLHSKKGMTALLRLDSDASKCHYAAFTMIDG
ncbi:hypothetical protein POTOM_005660 [Populus tomentosa]|uniref:RRM domain-containing protein n=1 Tax=Populus tomentosa TaxID=118781 RepID=A0A8X8AJQ6_POPTO|nr:hypothetical protein POTOM_005660 [Populus tomentosa]